MDGQCHKNYQLMVLSGFKNATKLNEVFVKNYSKDSNREYFFKVDIKYTEQLHKLHNDLTIFTRKNENLKK